MLMTYYTIKLVLQQCCILHVCDVTWKQETNDPIYVTSGFMWTKDPIYVSSGIMWKRKCFYLFLYLITFETLEQSSLFLFLVLCHTCLLLWMFLVCFLGNLTKNTYNKECRCYQEHRFIINVHFFYIRIKEHFCCCFVYTFFGFIVVNACCFPARAKS